MRLALTVLCSTCLLAATDPPPKKQPAPAAVPAKRLEIPAGAVERDHRYYYTDKDGKKWIYFKTPFGITRKEDTGEAASTAPKVDPLANVKVTEVGDTVKFERPGPFGVYKWEKKKQDLDEKEMAALERSRNAAAKQEK